MILEHTLVNPNFAGRDGFKWFIGQIAPSISNVNENAEAKGGLRCKVRILGYHPSDSTISNENLPWAHVLVPPSLGAGEGNYSAMGSVQPGTVVFGFFLDGDDGQQPVIVGAFYSGSDIESVKSWNNILSKGTSEFKPFSPPPIQITPPSTTPVGVGSTNKSSDRGAPTHGGSCIVPNPSNKKREVKNTILANQTEAKGIIIEPILKCETSSGPLSGITNLLRKFIRIANTVKDVLGLYINPILNKISDITNEIREIANAISDLLVSTLKKVRDKIIGEIYKLLKGVIDKLLPANLKALKEVATDKAVKQIWCVFERIAQKISDFILKFLMNMIGKFVSLPFCAAEAFLGSILGSIVNEITDSIQNILGEITSSLGGTISTVLSVLENVINASASAISFLSCEDNKCTQQYAYELNKGYIPNPGIGFDNIMKYSASQGVRNMTKDAGTAVDQFLGNTSGKIEGSEFLSCDATSINCIIPTVTIFGGGGSGAVGESVVNSLGQIIGVHLLSGGSGYNSAPFISFNDPCENGSGVQAYTTINDFGQVTNVVVTDPGSGYLGPSVSTTPCETLPVTENGSVIFGTIADVIVVEPGFGYTNSDIITDSSCPNNVSLKPKVDSEGRVVAIDIINPGSSINVFPELQINSDNGQGAVLLPVLNFKTEISYVETDPQKVQKVVYCAENHE
jgi:hypothetical protein